MNWVPRRCDPAYALLYDSVNKENPAVRIGAIQGLGLAYAGTAKEEVADLLCPLVRPAPSRTVTHRALNVTQRALSVTQRALSITQHSDLSPEKI
jgi:hypothetical protein